MNAYEIMHEWDRAAGNPPRSDEDLDRDVPAGVAGGDYEGWKARLEKRDVAAIREGLEYWGLPIGPLGPFEIDAEIESVERPD